MVADTAAAKEAQNYGLLTIQITGAGGSQRTILADSPEDQRNAVFMVTELGMVTALTTISASPPGLSRHYQIAVRQQPGAAALLPWSGLSSAEFYYYPGVGQTPAYVRCRIGRGSQPDVEAWLIAFPAVTSLLEPSLAGLAPMENALTTLPLKQPSANPATSAPAASAPTTSAVALTLLLVAAVATGIFLLYARRGQLTR